MKQDQATEQQINSEWHNLLGQFHKIITGNPAPEKVKEKLLDLKSCAENSALINIRQKEAIVARCVNYINGEYGNTKTLENLNHGKTS